MDINSNGRGNIKNDYQNERCCAIASGLSPVFGLACLWVGRHCFLTNYLTNNIAYLSNNCKPILS